MARGATSASLQRESELQGPCTDVSRTTTGLQLVYLLRRRDTDTRSKHHGVLDSDLKPGDNLTAHQAAQRS